MQELQDQPTTLLDLPIARLQIVQNQEVITATELNRATLEPTLTKNADGLWILSVHRQGEHSKFDVPYIGSEIVLANAELGLVVVLIGYHGTVAEKYGRLGYLIQKGQFYRYYQEINGAWHTVRWSQLPDSTRLLIISTIEEAGPKWARTPGKLQDQRKPPAKRVKLTSFKVVRLIEGRFYSLYDPEFEYVLGERLKEPVRKNHEGGFFSYPTQQQAMQYLTKCAIELPFHKEVETPELALLECCIEGKMIDYGHKWCSTYLTPLKVLEVRRCSPESY